MKRITINKSFFYSAGDTYGWSPKYDKRGVGIRMESLRNNTALEIVIDKNLYIINCAQAITFIKQYKSVEIYKGTSVGIVSKELLREVIEPKKQEESYPLDTHQESVQLKLL